MDEATVFPTMGFDVRRIAVSLVIGASVSLALTPEASAYKTKKTSNDAIVRWTDQVLPLLVHQSGDDRKDQMLIAAVNASADAWMRSSNVYVDVQVGTAGGAAFKPGAGNTSIVRWAEGDWPYDSGTLALTFLRYDVSSGEIYDADILVNDSDFDWADRILFSERRHAYDLQNTVTHEIGHAIGLAHTAIQLATMYASTQPSDIEKRFLHDDDIQGAQALYGSPLDGENLTTPAAPADAGGCQGTPGLFDPALFFTIFAFAFLVARGRRAPVPVPIKRRRPRRPRPPYLVLALMVLAPAAADAAGQDGAETLDQLVSRSDAVLAGTVLEQHTEYNDAGLIVTVSKIEVASCLRGSCPKLAHIVQLGGELNGDGLAVAGIKILEKGAQPVLLVRNRGVRWSIVGLSRGQLMDMKTAAPGQLEVLRARLAAPRR